MVGAAPGWGFQVKDKKIAGLGGAGGTRRAEGILLHPVHFTGNRAHPEEGPGGDPEAANGPRARWRRPAALWLLPLPAPLLRRLLNSRAASGRAYVPTVSGSVAPLLLFQPHRGQLRSASRCDRCLGRGSRSAEPGA